MRQRKWICNSTHAIILLIITHILERKNKKYVRKQIYENTKNCKMGLRGLTWKYGILSYYFGTYERYYPCTGSPLILGGRIKLIFTRCGQVMCSAQWNLRGRALVWYLQAETFKRQFRWQTYSRVGKK